MQSIFASLETTIETMLGSGNFLKIPLSVYFFYNFFYAIDTVTLFLLFSALIAFRRSEKTAGAERIFYFCISRCFFVIYIIITCVLWEVLVEKILWK